MGVLLACWPGPLALTVFTLGQLCDTKGGLLQHVWAHLMQMSTDEPQIEMCQRCVEMHRKTLS